MSETTLERLVDVEVIDDGVAVAEGETVVSDETPASVESQTEPEAILSQRVIGCSAILCAGCPLVMMCPSARVAETETANPVVSNDIFEANGWQAGFGEIETNLNLDSKEQASRRASDGTPVPIETRAADRPSPSESSPAEIGIKSFIENKIVKNEKPIKTSQRESESTQLFEQQPVRTYLDELLDDSIEFVVAQSLRQPVIAEKEPMAIDEIDLAAKSIIGAEMPVVDESNLVVDAVPAAEVTPVIKLAPATEAISLAVEPEIAEPNFKIEEPAVETVSMDDAIVIEKAVVVDNVIDIESPYKVEPTVDLVFDLEDVTSEIKEPETDFEVVGAIEVPLADNEAVEAVVVDEDFVITIEPITDVLDLINESALEKGEAEEGKTAAAEVEKETADEFHLDWREYVDDLDEERWPFDEDSDSLPIAKKFKKIIVKFLGRQAFYALSSSGSSAD